MTKEYIENILTEYGVAFTDSLADRLLKEFEPSNDMVSRGVFEQVMWERAVAMDQLEELGYGLGQKVEPCEDAISRTEVIKSIDEREDVNGKVDVESVRTDIVLMQPVNPQPKIGHCKDCKYFEYDSVAKVDGIPLIVAHEICKRWGDGCKTKEDGYCFMFEPQERSEE